MGPFRTLDLLICGIVLAIVGVICFVAKDMLGMPIVFASWIVILVVGVVIVLGLLFLATIGRYMLGGKEGFLFQAARADGKPIYVDVELGSGIAEFVLGEKTSPKDITFSDEESGIKVDPSLLSEHAKPMRFAKGLDVYIYSYYNYMPQSVDNSAAFKAIEDYFRTECSELNFLTIKEFVELVSDPEHYLEHNAYIKLNKYFKIGEKVEVVDIFGEDGVKVGEEIKPVLIKNKEGTMVPQSTYVRQFYDEKRQEWIEQDITLPDMIQKISQARKDISRLPSYTGPLAGTEAFKNNSVPYSSQHLSHVLMLYKDKMKLENLNKENILLYCIGAAIVLLGGGLAFYIVNMAPK